MPHPLDELLAFLATQLRKEPRPEAQDTAALYEAAIGALHPRARPHSTDATIRASLARLSCHEASLVAAAHDYIPWSHSAVLDAAFDSLGELFAAASLIGPESAIYSTSYRAGLFLQFPNGDYPVHDHLADESYIVLGGFGEWAAGEAQLCAAAGSIIHHPSRLPHALRTGAEPVLAAWRWSGNIDPSSYRLWNNAESTSGVKYIGN